MVGAATHFVLSARADTGIPPIALAGAGLLFGAPALSVTADGRILPLRWTTEDITYRFGTASAACSCSSAS